jgi:DNA-binding response OmpR family regulator
MVEVAADGHEAVAWAELRRPALVVLDLGLPLLDGIGVARILRSRYGARLPILVVSADFWAAEKSRHFGPCGLVPKPFDADVLVAAVRRGLDGT